ncbi:hypothetical protein [Streptomyces sp. NPDC058683]|uniref:hypothetical protein n=1 Tax=Streptomyces sp. NPDC058683 TaxID=3346597 RepID=UPI003664A2D7
MDAVERLARVGVVERVDRRVLGGGVGEDLSVVLKDRRGCLSGGCGRSRRAGSGIGLKQDTESEWKDGGNSDITADTATVRHEDNSHTG